MRKLMASVYKEMLLLTRDIGGLAVLFLMPLLLVVTITLIQDSTFKTIRQNKIPIVLVDQDGGEVSRSILDNLKSSEMFELNTGMDEHTAQEEVRNGRYQLAIVIPKDLTRDLNQKIANNVNGILEQFGAIEHPIPSNIAAPASKEVKLYFDPATQFSFRNSIKSGIDQMVAKVETQSIYKAFQEQITDDPTQKIFDTEPFIRFTEIIPNTEDEALIPNSTQHNVPAWTLFAIFFIILPLSINMVKEKNQGTFVRLRTHPVPYAIVLGGKAVVFLMVSLIQFAVMLLVGIYLFPMLVLPQLDVTGRLPLLFLVAFFVGLAAVGLGLLIGTLAKSQEQSAPFGATLVVILAAVGGVWVPVFAMPKFMQTLSGLSPMNWGLNAFYDVFLRNVTLKELVPEITLLFLFSVVTTVLAIGYYNKKNAV